MKTATTAGSDVANAAKAKRIAKNFNEARRRILAKEDGGPAARRSRWPKRKMRS